MGYDSRVYIVKKTGLFPENGKTYAQTLSVIEMGVAPEMCSIFKDETDCYIYSGDDESMIFYDCYEKPLTECSIPKVLDFLERDEIKAENYRRYNMLRGLLKSIQDDINDGLWGDTEMISVLHYGH